MHVYQFGQVGSIYIRQARQAQRGDGDDYGGWNGLKEWRSVGLYFRDYNREQQAQIAEDYYSGVILGNLASDNALRLVYEPFIEELQRGEL